MSGLGGWQIRKGIDWTFTVAEPQMTVLFLFLKVLMDPRATQIDAARAYALIICYQGCEEADWPRINQAIRSRWKGTKALERIKAKAWTYLERVQA